MIEGSNNTNNNQENEAGDAVHTHPKPRVAFLELTNNQEEIEKRGSPDMSPSRSPSSSRKPFIPPLDLSTLHEHVDSSGIIRCHCTIAVFLCKLDTTHMTCKTFFP